MEEKFLILHVRGRERERDFFKNIFFKSFIYMDKYKFISQ